MHTTPVSPNFLVATGGRAGSPRARPIPAKKRTDDLAPVPGVHSSGGSMWVGQQGQQLLHQCSLAPSDLRLRECGGSATESGPDGHDERCSWWQVRGAKVHPAAMVSWGAGGQLRISQPDLECSCRKSPEGLRMSGEAWQCPGCASRVAPWRRLRILRSPEILVETLKRWDTEMVEAAMWKRRMGSVWRHQVVSRRRAPCQQPGAPCR